MKSMENDSTEIPPRALVLRASAGLALASMQRRMFFHDAMTIALQTLQWAREHNESRPHASLNADTPSEFASQIEGSL